MITQIRGNTQIKEKTVNSSVIDDKTISSIKLADNIDATEIGFNAAKVGGKIVNDAQEAASGYLWTSQKILNTINNKLSGLCWREPCNCAINYIKDTTGAPTGTGSSGERCLNTFNKMLYTYTTSWDGGNSTVTGNYRFLFFLSGTDTTGNSGSYPKDNKIYDSIDGVITSTTPLKNWSLIISTQCKNVKEDSGWTYDEDTETWIQFSGAGQIDEGDGILRSGNSLSVRIKTSSGLAFESTQLKVNPSDFINTSYGFQITDNKICLKLKALGGLTFDSGSLTINTSSGTGIGLTSEGYISLEDTLDGDGLSLSTGVLSVNRLSNGGLAIGTGENVKKIYVLVSDIIDTTKAISDTSNKISLNVHTDGGLEIDSSSHGLKVKTGSGLENTSSGVTLASSSAGSGISLSEGVFSIDFMTGILSVTESVGTLSNTPMTNSLMVFINGQLKEPGAATDYILSGTTVTFNSNVWVNGDVVRYFYYK